MNELKKERWKKKKKKEHINDVGNKKSQARIYRLELIDGLSVNIDGIYQPLLDLYFSEVKIP